MNKLLIIISILLTFIISSCSSSRKVKEKGLNDLVHTYHLSIPSMRLMPRSSHPGHLSNRVCLGFDNNGKCTGGESIQAFDLSDQRTRDLLINFKFACYVGGKRYRICTDKNGLCRREYGCIEYKKKLISRNTYCSKYGTTKTHYLDIVKDFDYILKGGTECRANY